MGIGQEIYDTLVPEGSPGRGVDAAIARQFDETPGGGIFDADTYNPFNNTQAGREQATTIPLTGVDIAGPNETGVGYQPGQSARWDGEGYGPNNDRAERFLSEVVDKVPFVNQGEGPGDIIGKVLIGLALVGTFLVFLNAFAGGLGEGVAS